MWGRTAGPRQSCCMGPIAHLIRAGACIKMDKFYSVTVYEKVRGRALCQFEMQNG